MTYEQTLKQERKHYERECKIRKVAKKVQAESLADKRARYEFNRLMKEYGVEL